MMSETIGLDMPAGEGRRVLAQSSSGTDNSHDWDPPALDSPTGKLYWALQRSAVKRRKARWLVIGLRNQGWDWVECGRLLKDWARVRAWVGITAEQPPDWDAVDWAWLAHKLAG